MDTMVRNVDNEAYRELKARAALSGKTIGEALTEAIWSYVGRGTPRRKRGALLELLRPERFPRGNERLSEEIDAVAYGLDR